MIERIVRSCFARPFLAVVVVLAGAALGAWSLLELPQDVFPDLSVPVFNVIVQNAAMSAEELETAIAVPMETELAGLPGVRRVRSVSQLGVAQITVEFDAGADPDLSRQLLAERVNRVAADLPPGTQPPLLSTLTGRLNEIFEISLEAAPGSADLMTLRDLAEFEVRNRLLAVPGVASVERLGGYLRQFQVQIDPERMSARGVTLDEVLHAAEGASRGAAGGVLTRGSVEWPIRVLGRASSVADLRETVVAVHGSTPVFLGEIADVREAPATRRGLAHRLAGEIVSCRISKQFDADTVAVGTGIRRALDEIRGALPAGVELRVVYDQSDLVRSALGGVGRAVLLGALGVVFVLLVLLGNLRAALLVTLTIPLSVALAGVFLGLAGVGLNTMTLGGLAIAIGILVDAAIIVTENVVHRLAARAPGASAREVALAAALEVSRPIAFATLVVVAVFLPLFGIRGLEGRMYRPLALALIAAVGSSLVLALTLVPIVASRLLRTGPVGAAQKTRIVGALQAAYAPLLDACLRRAGTVRLVALAATIPAIALAFAVGTDFVPRLDEGALLIQTFLPAEASLEEVDRLNHLVEDALTTLPEVKDVVRRTGRAERTEDPMPHTVSDVLVVLDRHRERSLEAIEDAAREKLRPIPGVSFLMTTPLGMRIDEGLGGTPADLSVRIFGADLDELSRLAASAREILEKIEGIDELRAEGQAAVPQIRVAVDRAAAARAGLTPGDIVDAAQVGLVGRDVAEVWIGPRRYDVVVRLPDDRRSDLQALRTLLVDGHEGTRIPLEHLARIEESFGPGVVRREAGSRRVAVDASVVGRDLGSTAREARERLARGLHLPSGYFFDIAGRVESQARAHRSLMVAIAVAVLAVFVLLHLALGSTAETFVILATLPDAFVGGIVGLWLAGETWNVSSLVGLIGLFGIAVQNGLVLVTQTRALEASGRPFEEALREACIGRLRPKIMTAATAILGLLPLLVLQLPGTEIERPLAIVLVGGLLTSTLFTLLVLPTFYVLVRRFSGRARRPA